MSSLHSGFEISKSVLAIAPFAANGPNTGSAVDRTGYLSCAVDLVFESSGTPTGGTIALQLQDSADGVTFVNYGAPASVTVSAGNLNGGLLTLGLDLGGARQFVRAVETGTPTGGTSPVVSGAAVLRLFGPDRLPAI